MLANVGGVRDPIILAAAVLHDTIEDTLTSPEEIDAAFGREVRMLVQEVTDDKSLPKDERKRLQVEHSAHLSPSAKLIKLADRTANLRDVTEHPPSDWSQERRREYLDWSERVIAGCRDTNAPLERWFDETLRQAREIMSRDGDHSGSSRR